MVSINTTPLLTQLIPFNRTNPLVSGPYNVEFHRYRGNLRALHWSLGVFIAEGGNFDLAENAHFNFRIGTEKRWEFSERWTFYRGWDGYLSFGSFNVIGETSNQTTIIGLGPRWCIEYRITQPISVSIESALVIGLNADFGAPDFRFIPPVAINMNLILPRSF